MNAPELVTETGRARYWRTPGGLYRASQPGQAAPADNGAGYVSLQALMKLKGEDWGTWTRWP